MGHKKQNHTKTKPTSSPPESPIHPKIEIMYGCLLSYCPSMILKDLLKTLWPVDTVQGTCVDRADMVSILHCQTHLGQQAVEL